MITSESKRSSKKSLEDLLQDKTVVTGKEVVESIKEKERIKKEYEESVEFELRNRKSRKINNE